jgi:hypothetical protein
MATTTVNVNVNAAGSDGQVQFNNGGVFGADSLFVWDNTNKRLGVGVSPTATLDIKGSATSGFDAIKFQSQYSTVGYLGSDNSQIWLTTGTGATGSGVLVAVNSLSLKANDVRFLNNAGTEVARFTSAGQLTIGAATAGARLDIRAQGALSTNIAFRVRNSADTGNLFSVRGDGNAYLDSGGFIYGDSTSPFLRLSNALGVEIGYGTNKLNIGGAVLNFGTASVQTLRHRSNSGTRITDGANASDAANDGLQAVLALQSTTRGFLPPKMTNAQMVAISAPPAGLVVYDTTNNKLCCYDGTTWQNLF